MKEKEEQLFNCLMGSGSKGLSAPHVLQAAAKRMSGGLCLS